LRLAGHDAQIISYRLQYPNFLFPGSSQIENNGKAPENIPIHTLINSVNPFNWFKVARFIKKEKPDFILLRFWLPFFGPSLGTIARRVRKHTKVLALTDNIIPHEKRIGDNMFTSYFVKSCDGFIAMSQKVLNDIELFSSTDKKVHAPHPMYETYGAAVSKAEARQKLGIAHEDKIILFFGLVREYKGLDLLIEAMAYPGVRLTGAKLVIAGEFYDNKEFYERRMLQYELLKDKKVILHDRFIPNDEVKYYFCAADLVAQTYRNATNSGVSMVSYFYDKPMIVTNVGGLPEIVIHNKCGYVVEKNNVQIGEKITEYFNQNKEAEFTEQVKIEKKKYEWTHFINSLLELYNRC
jgi:D-inositol-3-phosphate glycosyltransferase